MLHLLFPLPSFGIRSYTETPRYNNCPTHPSLLFCVHTFPFCYTNVRRTSPLPPADNWGVCQSNCRPEMEKWWRSTPFTPKPQKVSDSASRQEASFRAILLPKDKVGPDKAGVTVNRDMCLCLASLSIDKSDVPLFIAATLRILTRQCRWSPHYTV